MSQIQYADTIAECRAWTIEISWFQLEAMIFCSGLVPKLYPTLATPWTVACQAPLSMEFSRQEWVAILLQEIFPSQGSNPRLLCLQYGQTDPLPLRHLGLSLFHLVSSPPQVNSGLDTWCSQRPKGETHIKVSWGQSQNLRSFLPIISCSQIKLHGTPRLKGQRKRFLPPEGRKGYVHSSALNLPWGALIHEGATVRWKFIHNSGHKFRPQTLLISKFLARYSLLSSVVVRLFLRNLEICTGCQLGTSLLAQWVKNPLPTRETWETWVWSLSAPRVASGTPLQYSCLEIPWTEGLEGYTQSTGPQKVRQNWVHAYTYTHTHTHTYTRDVSYEIDAIW